MANVPIVTEVTKAQLDALVAADGLNEGLQYKVTDKNWLLLATSSNTLISNNNVIKILNGEVIPQYIDYEFIHLDTGEITTDISTGIEISVDRLKFIPQLAILEIFDQNDELAVTDLCDGQFDYIGAVGNANTIAFLNPIGAGLRGIFNTPWKFAATGNGSGNSCQLKIVFKKIPVF